MRRIVANGFWCCAGLLLIACAKDASVTSQVYPAEIALTLSAEEKVAIVAYTEDDNAFRRCVEETLREAKPSLQLVPASEFRKMAGSLFSTTRNTMDKIRTALLESNFQAEARRLALRYLLIVDGLTTSSMSSSHAFAVEERRSRIEVKIWSIPAVEHLADIWAVASGSSGGLPPSYTATESAACERVAEMLGKRLN